MRRAVFLDRDDTLIHRASGAPTGDLGQPDDVALLPNVAEALRTLARAGYFLAVFTNQGGVARAAYPDAAVHAVNARLNQLLQEHGAPPIDDFRHCPYHPNGTLPEYTREHPWRKPAPGMLLDLARAHSLDLHSSWALGDQPRDVAAGRAAGCRTILIAPPTTHCDPAPDFHAPDILDAARHILDAPPRAS